MDRWDAAVAPFIGRCMWGDVRQRLSDLPDASVHMVVTSPPFWGLRSYLDADDPAKALEIGAEGLHDCAGWATGEPCGDGCYICHLVEVAREVRRVLRPDGTFWLECGDSYNGSGGAGGDYGKGGIRAGQPRWHGRRLREVRSAGRCRGGLKDKDLCMVPHRVALALQADGWWVRSDIVWHRENPMPSPVTDRPVSSHSYVFLLTKAKRYFYDAEAVREVATMRPQRRLQEPGPDRVPRPSGHPPRTGNGREMREAPAQESSGRNARDVWTINTRGFGAQTTQDDHYATFPIDLPMRCILAGTSMHGVCPACGAPWAREVERTAMEVRASAKRLHAQAKDRAHHRTATGGTMARPPMSRTVGWTPTCACMSPDAPCSACGGSGSEACARCGGTGRDVPMPVPAVVLDPFLGSGTTALAARALGRRWIGIDLNESYADVQAERLGGRGYIDRVLAERDGQMALFGTGP